jgi:molybdenum cofactor cytidylyltransferase
MIFGEIDLDDANGALLAHTTHAGALKLRKGHVLRGADIEGLRAAGVKSVTVARLEAGDIDENTAAERIGRILQFAGIKVGAASTGRVNFHAEEAGIFVVDAELITAMNLVDSSVTVATVKPFDRVNEGQMVVTVKIIPFVVSEPVMAALTELACKRLAFRVQHFTGSRIGLVQTMLPSLKSTVLDKTRAIVERRILGNHGILTAELRVAHQSKPLSAAIRELHKTNDIVLVFGASAVVDAGDIVPSAIIEAGGTVHQIGMPVDPGNLLILAELEGKSVIGAPGCARSPKENGFDWVLDRLMAELPVTRRDLVSMGVGGLLMEIPARPQLRDPPSAKSSAEVAIAVLAAGQPSRSARASQQPATLDGVSLIRRSTLAAIEAGGSPVVVVLGHQASECAQALGGLDVILAVNDDYGSGLASSLQCAVRRLPPSAEGAMILLADMTYVSAQDLRRLIGAFQKAGAGSVVRATFNGKRGNPVILPRIMFDEVFTLAGDVGARHLIERGDLSIIEVELGEAASLEADAPEASSRTSGL